MNYKLNFWLEETLQIMSFLFPRTEISEQGRVKILLTNAYSYCLAVTLYSFSAAEEYSGLNH